LDILRRRTPLQIVELFERFIFIGAVADEMVCRTALEAFIFVVSDLLLDEFDLFRGQGGLGVGASPDSLDGVLFHEFFGPHILLFAEMAGNDPNRIDKRVNLSEAAAYPLFMRFNPRVNIFRSPDIEVAIF
jgi:hypothetical protein